MKPLVINLDALSADRAKDLSSNDTYKTMIYTNEHLDF